MKLDKFFTLSWKRMILILTGFFLAVILHNFVSALFGFEDVLFFIIAVFVIPLYLLVSIVYSIIKKTGSVNRSIPKRAQVPKHRRRGKK
jgi:uncharacterized membrane protein YgaE (UPF0421/DUF939 family)